MKNLFPEEGKSLHHRKMDRALLISVGTESALLLRGSPGGWAFSWKDWVTMYHTLNISPLVFTPSHISVSQEIDISGG